MKKETTNEIQNYFTDEVREQISGMTSSDMKDILRGLEGTPVWVAILKYTQERIGTVQGSFLTLDPVNEPTKIARYQGAITGMLDLQDAVLNLKFDSERKMNKDKVDEENKNDLGGAYGKY